MSKFRIGLVSTMFLRSTFNGCASQNVSNDEALKYMCSSLTSGFHQPSEINENIDFHTPSAVVFSNRLNKILRNITRKETRHHSLCNTEVDKSDVSIFNLRKKCIIKCRKEYERYKKCDAEDCEVNNLDCDECVKNKQSFQNGVYTTYTPDSLDASDELDGSGESDGSQGSEAEPICLHHSLSSADVTNAGSTEAGKEDKDNKTVGESEKREETHRNVSQRPYAALSDNDETKSFFSYFAGEEQDVLLTLNNKYSIAEETCLEFVGKETNEPSILLGDKRSFMASHRDENYDLATAIHLHLPASKGSANSSSSTTTLSPTVNTDDNADDHFEEESRNRYSVYRGLTYELGKSDGPDISKNVFFGRVEYIPSPTPITEPFLLYKNLDNLSKKETMKYEEKRLVSFQCLNELSAFAIRLAMSGFYYDEEIDEILCFSCNKGKRHWERSEYPPFVHLQMSPQCKHANFQDETNVPIDIVNYTLLKNSMKDQLLQRTKQQTTGNTYSGPLSSMAGTDSGFESGMELGERIEPLSTLEKHQTNLRDDHADERSDALGGSSLSSLSSPPQCFNKGAALSSSLSSFSSKSGSADGTAPPEITFNTSELKHFVPSSPQVIQVYTTLMPSSSSEGKRFPVQAQQPADRMYSYPQPESGRLVGSRDLDQRGVIPEPLTPGLDMRLAASPMNSKVMIRLMSFENSWSMLSTGQSPKDLALAGFYYLGAGDSVRCFYCAITLREWKPGDDPWVVHVLARFSCSYVKAVKGDDFIVQTLIGHSKKHNSLSFGDRQTQLQSPSTSLASIQPLETASSAGQFTLDPKASTGANRSSKGPGQLSVTASSNASATSSASITMMQEGERNVGLVQSPDDREKVRTSHDLQTDCAATDRTGLNSSSSPSTTFSGGASALGTQSSGSQLTALKPDPEADLRRLVETNRRLRERRNCRLCRQRTVDTIFLPCGHICTCESCAKSIKICILCRKSIRGTAHVYLD